jgi:hypothetical protein
MNHLRSRRPSPALIVSAIALVLALGGTAAATSLQQLERATEPYHLVGATGEPQFGDGGQGDCVWANGEAMVSAGLNPPSFYRDPFGRVYLSGVAAFEPAPGGDGDCGPDDVTEDSVVFVLPPQYRPENLEVIGNGDFEGVVVPDEGAVLGGTKVPPGAVVAIGTFGMTVLDGTEFRAAGYGTAPIESNPVTVSSLSKLKHALD